MPDSNSSDPKPTTDDLSQVCPESWVHHREITQPMRRKEFKRANCVVIRRSRLNIPLACLAPLGNPTKVTCYFDGFDAILIPSSEFRLVLGKTWAYIPFEEKAKKFRPYLVQGVYPPGQFRVEDIGGIPYLRIIRANFTQLSRKWLTHWSQAQS